MTATMTRVHWYHPEWVALAVAATGWVWLVAAVREEPTTLLLPLTHNSAGALLTHAFAMTAAMMAPLVLRPVHDLAVASLWSRRYRAIASYLTGYLSLWAALGAVTMLAVHRLAGLVGSLPAIVVTSAVAVSVARTEDHRRRLAWCSGTRPLSLSGWRADRDCLEAGVRMCGRCVATTWALMLAVMVQGSLLVMLAGAAIMVLERRGYLRGSRAVVWTAGLALLAVLMTAGIHRGVVLFGPPLDRHTGH